MTQASDLDRRLEQWHRVEPALMNALPFGLLALSTGLTAVVPPETSGRRLFTWALVVACSLWVAYFRYAAPERFRVRTHTFYGYGLGLLTAALMWWAPWFAFFNFMGYLNALTLMRGYRRVGLIAITAASMAASQVGGTQNVRGVVIWAWIALTIVNGGLAFTFGHYGDLSVQQSEQRQHTIDELALANERLEAAMQENAELQVQLLARAREAGINDERQRLAREIHDTIAQGLAGIVTQLEAASQGGAQDADRHVAMARSLARESLGEARRSVQALRPGPLEDARLPEAITLFAKRWAERAGVSVHVEVTGDPVPLLAETEVMLYRVTQEALTNVARHADASVTVVTLSYLDTLVTLDVVDDGHGFDTAEVRDRGAVTERGGFGLRAMAQRVDAAAGRLQVESSPTGTALSVNVPVGEVVAVAPGVGSADGSGAIPGSGPADQPGSAPELPARVSSGSTAGARPDRC